MNKIICATICFILVSCSGVEKVALPPVVEQVFIPVNMVDAPMIESKFEVVKELPYFKEAVKLADCVYNLKEFQDEVAAIKSFGNTRDNGAKVVEKMLSPKKGMLRHYKASPKVIAYTVKDEIYFNSNASNKRTIEDNVNTLIHERLHVLGYRHISRFNIGRSRDNAYKIGKISEKYVGKCK